MWSPLGAIAVQEWERTVAMRPEVLADAAVVMPNHVHVLFGIVDVGSVDYDPHRRDTVNRAPAQDDRPRQFGEMLARSVSTVINVYKGAVTRQARRADLWGDGPLWQGRFHARVVRTPAEADRIRQYIADNPTNWATDRYGPLPPPRSPRRRSQRGGQT